MVDKKQLDRIEKKLDKLEKKLDDHIEEIWTFFSEEPLQINQEVYLELDDKDLLEFDSTCSNFFTH